MHMSIVCAHPTGFLDVLMPKKRRQEHLKTNTLCKELCKCLSCGCLDVSETLNRVGVRIPVEFTFRAPGQGMQTICKQSPLEPEGAMRFIGRRWGYDGNTN